MSISIYEVYGRKMNLINPLLKESNISYVLDGISI